MEKRVFKQFIDVKNYDTLGQLIKAIRQSRGHTQRSLASKLGTCRQHIQKWEYGICRPTTKRLDQLLDLLGYRCKIEIITKFYR